MAKRPYSVQLHEANEALTRANATIADLQRISLTASQAATTTQKR